MAADDRKRRRRKKGEPPVVKPLGRAQGKPLKKGDPPTVAPIAKPSEPPTVAPIGSAQGKPVKKGPPPTVAPIAKPSGPPVVKPVAKAPPVVQPVRADTAPPPPSPPKVKALDGAPGGTVPGGGVVERQKRASDRVASYSGMPTALLVLLAVLIPSVIAAVIAWRLTNAAVEGVDTAVNDWGASAAKLVAATDPDWWRVDHGTSDGLRKEVLDRIKDAEDEAKAMPEGPGRDDLLAAAQAAREKVVGLILADTATDPLLASLNRERLSNTLDDAVLGVEFFGGSTMSAMGLGTPMPPLGDFSQHGEAMYKTVRIEGGVQARMFLYPVRGKEVGSDGNLQRIGYAGVLLSLGSLGDLEGEAGKKALIAGGIVFGLGLFSALLAAMPLFPLRRILRDAEEFSRGDFDHRPSSGGSGEIGALARSIGRMALAARDREIEALEKAEEAKAPPPDHRRVVGDGLAPGPLLRVPGWESEGTSRPCFEIAGDFFDYAATEQGKFVVILSETSLWGLSAAFIAAEIRGLFRGLAPTATSARELLEYIGSNVSASLPKEASASAVVVFADPETGECEIARAGSGNPPVAWRFADKSLEKIEIEGPKIRRGAGPGNGEIPGETTVQLAARDRLTLFGNGLYRARNKRKEKFGEQNLDGLILKFGPMNSTAFVNMVVNEVDLFHEGAPQRDDMTMVTIRRLK